MGQTASLPSCVSGGCVTGGFQKIRVQKPCGRYEEVRSPCMASKVMGKHPEYLVVHCSMVDGDTVDITVISPNDDLKPGVPYMLYPKVESTELQGEAAVTHNIPGQMCMSMKDRQLTIRNSTSPSMSMKDRQLTTRSSTSPDSRSKKNFSKMDGDSKSV